MAAQTDKDRHYFLRELFVLKLEVSGDTSQHKIKENNPHPEFWGSLIVSTSAIPSTLPLARWESTN
jgi:inner membrane protein involved in colicin E2 resistance